MMARPEVLQVQHGGGVGAPRRQRIKSTHDRRTPRMLVNRISVFEYIHRYENQPSPHAMRWRNPSATKELGRWADLATHFVSDGHDPAGMPK
jgi:hypothetical protein